MNVVKYLRTMICAACLLMIGGQMAMAQVIIGALDAPQDFSILELISNDTQGLRLPQLTQAERDLLDGTEPNTTGASAAMLAARTAFAAERTGRAEGLTIFNTTTKCVETWNGTVWLLTCECGSQPCPTAPPVEGVAGVCLATVPGSGSKLTLSNRKRMLPTRLPYLCPISTSFL
jgi:hypothetical protein